MRYCLGLPYSRTRPLGDDEIGLIQGCFRVAKRQRIVTCSAAWVTPFVVIIAAMAVSNVNFGTAVSPSITMIGMIAMISIPAVAVVVAQDAKRRYRLLRASIGSRFVDEFEGNAEPDEMDLDIPPRLTQELVIRIPETGLILNVLRSGSTKLLTADESFVAERPIDSPIAALLPGRVELKSDFAFSSRALTAEELRDVNRMMDLYTKVKWWQYAIFAYFTAGLVLSLFPHTKSVGYVRIVFYAAYDVFFVFDAFRRLRLRSRFKSDCKAGIVLKVEHGLEVLPSTGYAWTVDGLPSKDRRTSGEVRQV